MNFMNLEERINDYGRWMVCENDGSLYNPSDDDSDECLQVYVDIHMNNGDTLSLDNKCLRSFYEGRYMGDRIEVYEDEGYLDIQKFEYTRGEKFRHIVIPVSAISWVDGWSSHLDWNYIKSMKNKGIEL